MEGIGLGLKEAFKYTFIAILIIVSLAVNNWLNFYYVAKNSFTMQIVRHIQKLESDSQVHLKSKIMIGMFTTCFQLKIYKI